MSVWAHLGFASVEISAELCLFAADWRTAGVAVEREVVQQALRNGLLDGGKWCMAGWKWSRGQVRESKKD